MSKIEKIIKIIRDSFDDSVKVYTQGSCVRFVLLLKEIFPEGSIVYNSDHAAFLYGKKYYDITGEIENKSFLDVEEHYNLEDLKQLRYGR